MQWITEDLKKRIKARYEPLYKRPLTDSEVIEIALNLTSLVEHFLEYKRRVDYGTNNR